LKINSIRTISRATLALIAAFIFLAPVATVLSQGIAYGHRTTDELLVVGMAAQLDSEQNNSSDSTNYVQRSDANLLQAYIGVVAQLDSTTATIGGSGDQVFIKSNGQVSALVSDEGGDVVSGDKLILSAYKGVFSKTDKDSATWNAIALGSSADADKESVTVGDSAKVGFYRLQISLDNSSNYSGPDANSSSGIKRLGQALVGKDVGEARIIASLIIFVLLLVVEGGVVYGAISSSLTSLGRNPLASVTIKKEMIRVLLVALLILMFGLTFAYAILWL
jgi:hypothetical protein